jgi:hypothetical protein
MPSLAVGIILHGLYVSSEISLSNATQRNENEIEKEKNKKNEKNENGQEEKNENDNGTRKKGGRRRHHTTRLDSTRSRIVGRGSWVVRWVGRKERIEFGMVYRKSFSNVMWGRSINLSTERMVE